MKQNIKFRDQDWSSIAEVTQLIHKIETLEINEFERISAAIVKYQPFYLRVLLGYKGDVSREELDEIMRLYYLIWIYFESKEKVQGEQITQFQFEQTQKHYIHMFRYSVAEDKKSKQVIYEREIQQFYSKTLLAALHARIEEKPVLINLNQEMKAVMIMGIYGFIQCFEAL